MEAPKSGTSQERSASPREDAGQGEPSQVETKKGIRQGREAVEKDRGEAKVTDTLYAAGGMG